MIMKKLFRLWTTVALGVAAAVAVSSCAYDPYYSSAGGYYDSGYGYGHGYGGSSFSTSLFVSTGNPRWGYDPYCNSYYDYTRRAYYDPYLHGYYPVGYRPQVVVGVPHPHGWRRGQSRIAPPSRIRDNRLTNYNNRYQSYRNSNHSWARNVRQHDSSNRNHGRPGQGPSRGGVNNQNRPDHSSWNQNRGGNRGNDRANPNRHGSPSGNASGQLPPPRSWNQNQAPAPQQRGSRTEYQRAIEMNRGSQNRGARLPTEYNVPVRRDVQPPQPQTRPDRSANIRPQPTREFTRPEAPRAPRQESRPEPRPAQNTPSAPSGRRQVEREEIQGFPQRGGRR